jgi:glyoxylase-like metal-dependent hydrolase (beta-lactamase superfamily II)
MANDEALGSTRVDFSGGPVDGDLPDVWIHGTPRRVRSTDPPLQVHRFDEHTFVLRQGKAETWEAPFLYLLFGNERALLFDTGAVADPRRMPLRSTVDGLVTDWLDRHPTTEYELIVAHSHSHGDHVAGDAQFEDRPNTVVVGHGVDAVQQFFGFTDWPGQRRQLDLGGRVLEVTGCPGHHATSIAVLDSWSGFLLTGDTVYPGRLYVNDAEAFHASLEALVHLAQRHNVRTILGGHIEMTRTARRDYPIGARYQPDEPSIAMTVDQLCAVRDAARDVREQPGAHMFDDFAIYNGRCSSAVARLLLRRAVLALRMRLHLIDR